MTFLTSSVHFGSRCKFIPILGAAQRQTTRSYAGAGPRSNARSPVSKQISDLRRREQETDEARQMDRNFTREWKAGDVYAPHDLSAAEARKWRKRTSPTTDAFDALSLNPLDLYKNFSVMSEYMTDMGRIRHSKSTGLRAVNQRKIAKAIRRAIALGLMPSVHRHPEILRKEMETFAAQNGHMP